MSKRYYLSNLGTCIFEKDKYLGSIVVDWVITCNEIKDTMEAVPTKAILTISTLTKFLYFTRLFIKYHSVIDNY